MTCNGCGKPIKSGSEPIAHCAACKAQYHPACTKTKAGDSPIQCCPSCGEPVQWQMASKSRKTDCSASSFEVIKSSWFHKVVRVGIKERHTVDVRINQWTGREVIKVDGQALVDHHVFKGSNKYQFRVGKDEQYDVAVNVSVFGLSVNVVPAATSSPSVQMQGPIEVNVHGGGCCSGCGCGLLIAFLGAAASILIAIFSIMR